MLLNCDAGENSRVPWTARRSNQSILKEINPEFSLKGLVKVKLLFFDHLMQRADSLQKTLILGKIEGRRRKGWQRTRWLVDIIDSNLSLSKLQEIVRIGKPGVLQSMWLQRVRPDLATEQQQKEANAWTLEDADERNWRWWKQKERYAIFLNWKNQYCQNDFTASGNL